MKRLPFSYRPGVSVFHRLPAGLKLLGLLVFSSLILASPYGLVLSALLLIVACIVAGIPPGGLLRGSKMLMILALIIVFARTVGPGNPGIVTPGITVLGFHVPSLRIPAVSVEGFLEGVIAAMRILVVFAAAGFLFAVTTMRELRLSLAALENRVKNIFLARRKKRTGRNGGTGIAFFSLGISLMLGFIPRFFEMWETANLACQARSCKRGLRRLLVLLPLVTERMMEAAAETVLALEARGLGQGNE